VIFPGKIKGVSMHSVFRALLMGMIALAISWATLAIAGPNEDLIAAAQLGDMPRIQALLNKGADTNAKDINDKTALMHAAEKGHLDVVKALLANSADVNIKRKDGATALILASGEGHTAIVKELLDKGAEVNIQAKDGVTALLRASWRG
jgi:ankyrin repeat protein